MTLLQNLAHALGLDADQAAPPRKEIDAVQTIVYRGEGHRDFCQDFLVQHDSPNFFVGVILDGSSGGIHSQFASALFGKIFNLLLRSRGMLDKRNPSSEPIDIAADLMYEFCRQLVRIKGILSMAHNELLCTILLEVYSKEKDKLFVVAFGDGYVRVNGVGYKIENTKYGDTVVDGELKLGVNKPDYLIDDIDRIIPMYEEGSEHLKDSPDQFERFIKRQEDQRARFDQWFLEHKPTFEFHGLKDFSIATDGIFTFHHGKDLVTDQVIELLLDRTDSKYGGIHNERDLRSKMNIIAARPRNAEDKNPDKLSAVNDDDVSLIRVVIAQ